MTADMLADVKAIGPLAGLLTQAEWNAVTAVAERGVPTRILGLTDEVLQKLAAGKGVLIMLESPVVAVVLWPMPAVMEAIEHHRWTDEEKQFIAQLQGQPKT